jgi:hypothetical protein
MGWTVRIYVIPEIKYVGESSYSQTTRWCPWTGTTSSQIVICIARLRNPTLTNREKNCRQGRFAAETRQSRGCQRIS